jgi:hypothetical protein
MKSGLFLLGLCGVVATGVAGEPQRFYKGNTHAHSLWSDGNDFPEMILEFYHREGYDFAVLSDHDVLSRGYRWMSLAEIEQRTKLAEPSAIEKCEARFGADWITWAEQDGEPGIVLKTLQDIRPQLEAPGEFLIIEAEEISSWSDSGPVHINAINLDAKIDSVDGKDLSTVAVMREVLQRVQAHEARIGRPVLAHLNHPNFHWAVTAEELAMVVEEQFYEVYNGHPSINHPGDETRPGDERIWDIANTIRIGGLREAPLFGVATDDSHQYHGGDVSPGRGWIQVEAEALTGDALIRAMRKGAFYASSGVELVSIGYDPETRVLELEIEADGDATFVSELIGTREGYGLDDGPRVGEVLATQTGRQVRFVVPEDALYARVSIDSSAEHPNPSYEGQKKQAWTQPVGWRERLAGE